MKMLAPRATDFDIHQKIFVFVKWGETSHGFDCGKQKRDQMAVGQNLVSLVNIKKLVNGCSSP